LQVAAAAAELVVAVVQVDLYMNLKYSYRQVVTQ
jgi:hypothetical protein